MAVTCSWHPGVEALGGPGSFLTHALSLAGVLAVKGLRSAPINAHPRPLDRSGRPLRTPFDLI